MKLVRHLHVEPLERRELLTGVPTSPIERELYALDPDTQYLDSLERSDNFGSGLAFSGDLAVVGAHGKDESGAVYVYQKGAANNQWTARHKLVVPDAEQFGKSVAIVGNANGAYTIAVGAPEANGRVSGSGAVYVYENYDPLNSTDPVPVKLFASDGSEGDDFGEARGLDIVRDSGSGDETILVCANKHAGYGRRAGEAYVFTAANGNWNEAINDGTVEEVRLTSRTSDTPESRDQFGWTGAMGGDTIVIGGRGVDHGYVFERISDVWTHTDSLSGFKNGFAVSDDGNLIVASNSGLYSLVTVFQRQDDNTWPAPGDAIELWPVDENGAQAPAYRFGQAMDVAPYPGDVTRDVIAVADGGEYPMYSYMYAWNRVTAASGATQPWDAVSRQVDNDDEGRFGWSGVATDGRIVLVADSSDDGEGTAGQAENVGSVYVFAVNPIAAPPSIESLSDNPDPVMKEQNLTLTANGVVDDQTVVQVDFYRDAIGVDTLVGIDTDGSDGWSVIVPIAADFPTGDYTYFAQATDNDSELSNVVSTTNEVASIVVTIAATDANAAESLLDEGTFTVTREGDVTGDLTVSYSVVGTAATNGDDYAPLSGSVTILNGESTAAVVVTPVDDTEFEGDETVVLTLEPGDYSIGTPDSDTVVIADNDQPSEVVDYAISEITLEGTVISGSVDATKESDNIYEAIKEYRTGGKPSNRKSLLDHRWEFLVTGGDTVTFFVEAFHTPNTEGDDFVFQYSTDDVNYFDMVTVTAIEDTDTLLQSDPLPAGISGTVHVRVLDTDRTGANTFLDEIAIDRMYFLSNA